MRLIDADALFPYGAVPYVKDGFETADKLYGIIKNAPTIEAEPVKHGRWVKHSRKAEDCDGFLHHMCSHCKTEAPFHYIYVDDYDEGMDGEWYLLGQREDGIEEVLSKHCPSCGAKMDLEEEDDG